MSHLPEPVDDELARSVASWRWHLLAGLRGLLKFSLFFVSVIGLCWVIVRINQWFFPITPECDDNEVIEQFQSEIDYRLQRRRFQGAWIPQGAEPTQLHHEDPDSEPEFRICRVLLRMEEREWLQDYRVAMEYQPRRRELKVTLLDSAR